MNFLLPNNTNSAEGELTQLRAENHTLAEELAQCQSDKEFVWSLWKRLQVASPDITQAVGLVVQREKEKAELKDRKVLEILQIKDDKIDELQRLVTSQSQELSGAAAKRVHLLDEDNKLRKEAEFQTRENEKLRAKVEELQSRAGYDASRDAVRELDKENLELKQKLSKHEAEREKLHRDTEDLNVIKESQKVRIKELEETLKEVGTKYDYLVTEHNDTKRLLSKYENEIRHKENDLEAKSRELETVRKELSDIWLTHNETVFHGKQQSDLIFELQNLHKNAQKMLKEQDEVHSIETTSVGAMCQRLKAADLNQREQIFQQDQKLESHQIEIDRLRRRLGDPMESRRNVAAQASLGMEDKDIQAFEVDLDLEYKLQDLRLEVDLLRDKLREKNRIIRDHDKTTVDRSVSPIRQRGSGLVRKDMEIGNPSKMTAHKESDLKVVQRRLLNTEKKLENTQVLLHIKTLELEELRTAHNKRLDRLKSLANNHRLVKKQLQLLEEETGTRKRRKKLMRTEPKALQKEDSDAVWNELAYYKNESKNLRIDRMNLQEEVDMFRVKTSQDVATIHELGICLAEEKEELQLVLDQQKEDQIKMSEIKISEDIEVWRQKAQELESKTGSLRAEYKRLETDQARLMDERRQLRAELTMMQERDSQRRIEIADIKKERNRLQRELKRRRRRKNPKPEIAKQYQRLLNHSIHQMSEVFDNFDKDGWEEVSDTEETATDLTTTTGTGTTTEGTYSLGQGIVNHAESSMIGQTSFAPDQASTPSTQHYRTKLAPSSRQMESIGDHVRRMSKKNETPTRDISPTRISPMKHKVPTRSVALSPIHINISRPHVVNKKQSVTTSRQLSSMKQRIAALQQQVTILKDIKETSNRAQLEQKKTIEQIQADLNLANQRLQTSRLTVQRLSGEVDRLRADKDMLERQLEEGSVDSQYSQRSDQEWISLNAKLRAANTELSKYMAQIKQLKATNSDQSDKILQLQEKNNHLERDINQKKTLVEDTKLKLKAVQQNALSDAEIMVEVEGKLKELAEINARYKTQLESQRQRLLAVTKEKYGNQDSVIRLTEEIEKRSKLISDLQKKNGKLNGNLSLLEKTAQQQLQALASQSEAAIDTAQTKITQTNAQLHEFYQFVQILVQALRNSIHQARLALSHKKTQAEAGHPDDLGPSVKRVQNLACDILNISESDLEDLMCADDKRASTDQPPDENKDDAKKEKKWLKKCQKLLKRKENFAVPLVELLMEKVEDRNCLSAELGHS